MAVAVPAHPSSSMLSWRNSAFSLESNEPTPSNWSLPPRQSSLANHNDLTRTVKDSSTSSAAPVSVHAKLRKRNNSAASSTFTATKPPRRPSLSFQKPEKQKKGQNSPTKPSPSQSFSSSTSASAQVSTAPVSSRSTIPRDKLRPYLRKLSQRDQTQSTNVQDTLDLSRSVADNDTLLGLDTYMDTAADTGATSPYHSPGIPLSPTSRSISYHSQQSGVSGSFRPTAPFAFNMQPTARTTSFDNSVNDSEESGDLASLSNLAAAMTLDDAERQRSMWSRQLMGPSSHASLEDMRGLTRPLAINTSGSRSPGSPLALSPRNLSPTRAASVLSSSRPRGLSFRSTNTDITSPGSQSGIDRALTFLRSNKDEPIDPLAREASIQAAREAFDEREKAKASKYEKQQRKAAGKRDRKSSKASQASTATQQSTSSRPTYPPSAASFHAGREYAHLPRERAMSSPVTLANATPRAFRGARDLQSLRSVESQRQNRDKERRSQKDDNRHGRGYAEDDEREDEEDGEDSSSDGNDGRSRAGQEEWHSTARDRKGSFTSSVKDPKRHYLQAMAWVKTRTLEWGKGTGRKEKDGFAN